MHEKGTERVKRLPQPILMLVTEPRPNLPEIVAGAVAGGVNVVLWREKAPAAGWERRARELREAAGCTLLLVNGPLPLARASMSDGMHLPEDGMPIAEARRSAGADALIGRSIHSIESAIRAEEEGADYVIAGTIFASLSHPELVPAGIDFLREVCTAVKIPVIAIGGVGPENVADCLRVGAAGVAVLSPIMRATDPRIAAQAYRIAMEGRN